MDLFIFFIGSLLFIGAFIYLIVSLIKKKFAKKVFFMMLAGGFILPIVGLSMPSDGSEEATSEVPEEATVEDPELTEEEAVNAELEAKIKAEEEAAKQKAEEEAKIKVEEEAKEESIPREYKSALKKADAYAETMHMSKAGIYDQLTSEYGENFPTEAAQYAIDNIVFDWKENALKKAKIYAETMNMSNSAIYDQLISEYGEKFTSPEAKYAIDNLK